MDYARAYDEYWSRADRTGTHSFANADTLAAQILAACGTGRMVDLGCGMGLLVHRLLRLGVDAYGTDVSRVAASIADATAPGRFVVGDLRNVPWPDGSFDTVLSTDCLEHLEEADVPAALAEMRRIARRCLYLRIATRPDRDGEWHLTVRPRTWWEERLLEAGFRKHPSYYWINDYEGIDDDAQEVTLLMEPIDPAVARVYSLPVLARERDLHMDMLRETGARSDAHVIRYRLASKLIRPGDTVLDAACGLGYGAYLMHSQAMAAHTIGMDESRFAVEYAAANFGSEHCEFRTGVLPASLSTLAADSVDLIASFETLEHLEDPAHLLQEFARVLKPSGRIVLSVPNDWSDESGSDPSPHHCHVYTWPRIRAELKAPFIVEAAYEQTASRRKTGAPDSRTWTAANRRLRHHRVSALRDDALPDCEWWIVVAMKDPSLGVSVPYVETAYPVASNAQWNASAFGRDYRNPWLVNGMVTIGHRLSDDEALIGLARKVVAESAQGSADVGAALCVIGYRHLASAGTGPAAVAAFAEQCAAWFTSGTDSNPHRARWQISLWFLLGRLWQAIGDFGRATEAFESCAGLDPLLFSPLIATKSVEACLQLALLALARADREGCARNLRRGVDVAERAVRTSWTEAVGSLEHPAEFGLAELALVVERASACAYALTHMDLLPERPGLWWWQHRRDRASQLEHYLSVEADLITKNASIHEQTGQIHALWHEVETRQHVGATLTSEVHRLNEAIFGKDATIAEVVREVRRLHAVVVAKDDALAHVTSEIRRLEAAVAAKDAAFPLATAEIHRLEGVIRDKDIAIAGTGVEIHRLHAVVVAKDDALAHVTSEIRRLEAAVAAKDAAFAPTTAEIHRLEGVIRDKDIAIAGTGVEIHRLHAVVVAKDDALAHATSEIRRLEAAVAAKDAAFAPTTAEIHRLEGVIRDKDMAIAGTGAEIHRLHDVIAAKDATARQFGHAFEQMERTVAEDLESVRRLHGRLAGSDVPSESHADAVQAIARIVAERERELAKARSDLHDEEYDRRRIADELTAIRNSRWHQLGDLLRGHPDKRREWPVIVRLCARMLRDGVRRRRLAEASSTVAKPPPAPARPDSPQPTGYVIKNQREAPAHRPRVVHVIANFMTGGSSRLVVDLIEGLGHLYRQTIVTSYVPSPPAYRGADVRVFGLSTPAAAIRETLAAGGINLVHVHYWGEGDEPWYRHVLDALREVDCAMIENVNTPVYPLRSDRIARYVYVSKYVQRQFGDRAYPEEVIYPGLDLSLFTPDPRQEMASDTLGMVYRLERDKLNDLAMEPLIDAVHMRPGTRVLVVGGGTLLEQFRRRVDEAGVADRFTFTGYVQYEALPALYASMGVFVAPVWKESFGQVSAFAMSMGVPVAGYAVGAIPEILDDATLVAPPGDSKALAEILVRMLDDPERRKAIAAGNRARVHSLYSVEAMIARYRDLYGELVEVRV